MTTSTSYTINPRLYAQYNFEKKNQTTITRGMKVKQTKNRKARIKNSFVNSDKFYQKTAVRPPRG